jgi:hypothetical protein
MGRGSATGYLSFSTEQASQCLLLLLTILPWGTSFHYRIPWRRPRCGTRGSMGKADDLLGTMGPLVGLVGH